MNEYGAFKENPLPVSHCTPQAPGGIVTHCAEKGTGAKRYVGQ
jgi:hypothetical protein